MKTKLQMLKQYIDKQADDHFLWFKAQVPTEKYLQEELRRIGWLIEVASAEQIQNEINRYEVRL